MSKESYIRGFCKAAEAKGVDPKALAKFAALDVNNLPPPKKAPAVVGYLGGLFASKVNPDHPLSRGIQTGIGAAVKALRGNPTPKAHTASSKLPSAQPSGIAQRARW